MSTFSTSGFPMYWYQYCLGQLSKEPGLELEWIRIIGLPDHPSSPDCSPPGLSVNSATQACHCFALHQHGGAARIPWPPPVFTSEARQFRTYSDVMPKMQREASGKVEDLLFRK